MKEPSPPCSTSSCFPRPRRMSLAASLMSEGSWPPSSGVRHHMVSAVMYVIEVPELDRLHRLLQEKLLVFTKFRCVPTRTSRGVYIWQEVRVDVAQHVFRENVQDISHLRRRMDEVINAEHKPDQPRWDMYILQNQQQQKRGQEEASLSGGDLYQSACGTAAEAFFSAIMFRFDHCIGDGVSMVEVFSRLLTDMHNCKLPDNMLQGLTRKKNSSNNKNVENNTEDNGSNKNSGNINSSDTITNNKGEQNRSTSAARRRRASQQPPPFAAPATCGTSGKSWTFSFFLSYFYFLLFSMIKVNSKMHEKERKAFRRTRQVLLALFVEYPVSIIKWCIRMLITALNLCRGVVHVCWSISGTFDSHTQFSWDVEQIKKEGVKFATNFRLVKTPPLSVDCIRAIKRAAGCSVNDVFMCACSGMIRR
eukprot:GHVS01063147.1.p1 GENE.GHVS01063147.1~~GHVS01063147.1.p1  ORF type:complete len:420 (-),score=51.35 GHVS01063147.1:75-1334(-)